MEIHFYSRATKIQPMKGAILKYSFVRDAATSVFTPVLPLLNLRNMFELFQQKERTDKQKFSVRRGTHVQGS